LGLAAVAIFLFFFNPASPANQWFPKCPFRLLTGWQCPGCGSTRALYQLLHLHPLAAFKLNPLMVLTLPFIVYGFLGLTRSAVLGKPQRRLFIPPVYLWTWLALRHWQHASFGPLNPRTSLRIVIPGVLAAVLGVQVVLSSLFLSVLGMRVRKRSGPGDEE